MISRVRQLMVKTQTMILAPMGRYTHDPQSLESRVVIPSTSDMMVHTTSAVRTGSFHFIKGWNGCIFKSVPPKLINIKMMMQPRRRLGESSLFVTVIESTSSHVM
jgi:hypothetical protein